jgi:hypothetical protein
MSWRVTLKDSARKQLHKLDKTAAQQILIYLNEKVAIDITLYLLHMKNVQRFAQAPRGLYRSQDLFANLQVRAVYKPAPS